MSSLISAELLGKVDTSHLKKVKDSSLTALYSKLHSEYNASTATGEPAEKSQPTRKVVVRDRKVIRDEKGRASDIVDTIEEISS